MEGGRVTKEVSKKSLLVVSHTYAVNPHALKLVALGEHFDVTCVTVSRQDAGFEEVGEVDHRLAAFRTELPVLGSVTKQRFVFRGLNELIRSRQWDYLLVESEPWQPVKWQALILAKLAGTVKCYGEFTWENMIRAGLKGMILEWVYRFSARAIDFWIAGNRRAGEILCGYGMPSERVLVCTQVGVEIPKLLDGDRETRAKELRTREGIPDGAFVAGFAGRLVPEKGIEDLFEALSKVNKDRLAPIYMVLMGRGPVEGVMRRRQTEVSWLRVLPPVSHDEVAEHLPIMDLLVLGSHAVRRRGMCWEEQFGHILVEAMAVGTVVAGARSGAIPEVIDDSEVLFDSGNVDQLAAILRRFADERNFLESRRSIQGVRVRSKYSHEAVAAEYAKFLEGINPRR
jgi:glycosyltransferase involved in cell wall biosynthesis